MPSLPVVLSFAGHDPTSGAGIVADIEAIRANGAYGLSVISCLTDQDTHHVKKLYPMPVRMIQQQLKSLTQDFQLDAIKIGLIGRHEVALMLVDFLSGYAHIPIIFDPVLAAGGGTPLAKQSLIHTMCGQLLPLVSLVTPNSLEARQLTGLDDLMAAGNKLLDLGAKACLITGTHEATESVVHYLFRPEHEPKALVKACRLSGEYHGSGCTLSAAIASHMAKGHELERAVTLGHDFTWMSLKEGFCLTSGQKLPNRLHRLVINKEGKVIVAQ